MAHSIHVVDGWSSANLILPGGPYIDCHCKTAHTCHCLANLLLPLAIRSRHVAC